MTSCRPLMVATALGAMVAAACGAEGKLDPGGPGAVNTGLGGASAVGTGGAGGGSSATGAAASGGTSGISDCPVGGSGGGGRGGQGGQAGRGGQGGRAGQGGGGGSSDPMCPPATLPDCPGDGPVCGDGRAQTCLRPAQGGSCPKAAVVEACDGADVRQQTCQGQGFGSGTLACSSSCTFDVSGCRECASDGGVIRCGDVAVGASPPPAMAIAATDVEVALAWAEPHDDRSPTLRFARLDTGAALVSAVALDDPAFAATPAGVRSGLAVVVEPLPSGWVVVGQAATEVFAHAVDATGRGIGRVALADIPVGGTTTPPLLAGRPGAGPLVVWTRLGVVRAAVLSADGRSATAPIMLPIDTATTTGPLSAAFVGDAFYVATAVYDDVSKATSTHLRLVRVTPDGKSATGMDALPGADVRSPQIVAGTDELRVVYAGRIACTPGSHKLSQRVSPAGEALSPPVRLADHERGVLSAAPVAIAADTASVLLGFDQSLLVTRNAPDGTPAVPARAVALSPASAFSRVGVARRGPDLVVAWITPTRPGIQLALVTP